MAKSTFKDEASAVVAVLDMELPNSVAQGFSSVQITDTASRIKIYNAMTSAKSLRLEALGETIYIKDLIVQPVEGENDETGEIENYLRTTLLTIDGEAYSAGSNGVSVSVRNILAAFGHPNDWVANGFPNGLPVRAVQKPSGKGRGWVFTTLEYAGE